MKIAVITGGACALPPEAIGAVEILWYNVGRQLASCGHRVFLTGKGTAQCERDEGLFSCQTIRGFDIHGIVHDVCCSFFTCLQQFFMLGRCDILVCNNFWGEFLAKFFWFKYQYLISHVHRMPKGFFQWRCRGADLYVCPTLAVAQQVRVVFNNKINHKVVVVPNPIDVESFRLSGSRFTSTGIVVAYHGRVNREKGLHLLASAIGILANEYSDICLKIIGAYEVEKGGSGELYKKELDELSGGRIQWLGPIADRKKLADAISQCTIYCYPSLAETGETFGVAPLEAMGAGCPVVVSSLACFKDFVTDGDSGVVFDHRSGDPVQSLTSALKRLIDDDALRNRLSVRAAEVAREFSVEKVAKKMEDVFKALVNR